MDIVSKDNELIYLSSIICDLLNDLENIWEDQLAFKKRLIYDRRIQLLIDAKNNWVEAFMREEK